MDKQELLAIYDQEQRIQVDFPGVIRDMGKYVIRHRMPDGERGFIAYSSLTDANAAEEIEGQVAFHEARGLSFEWKVFDHDQPADLRQRLAARGFELEPSEALMVLDLQEAPDFYHTLALPPITHVTDRAGIDAIMRMEEAVWQEDHSDLGKRLSRDLEEIPDFLDVYAVQEDDRVVSAAWVYYHPPSRFASLWGGSTLEAYRGRGYYTALLVIRAREALRRGFRFLTVDASPMSRPILEKHGFQFLGFSTPCIWRAHRQEEISHG